MINCNIRSLLNSNIRSRFHRSSFTFPSLFSFPNLLLSRAATLPTPRHLHQIHLFYFLFNFSPFLFFFISLRSLSFTFLPFLSSLSLLSPNLLSFLFNTSASFSALSPLGWLSSSLSLFFFSVVAVSPLLKFSARLIQFLVENLRQFSLPPHLPLSRRSRKYRL